MPNDKEMGGNAAVALRDRYIIFPNSPLPDLANPTGLAFQAEDKKDRDRAVFAIIVKPGMPARIPLLKLLKGVDNPGMMTLLEWGVIDWPPAGRKVMAMIYIRPLGGRLLDAKGWNIKRMDENEAIKRLFTPALAALKFLRSQNVTHRGIRPTNLFWTSPERDRLIFGDACAGPPAFDQPSSVEPVEFALSMPAGRGEGTNADDIYACGASFAMALQARDITVNVPEEAVIRHKMLNGSYSAVAGEARLPLPLVEVLRGMLCDDPLERWDTEAIDLWINGRRLTPLVPRVEKKAIRSFTLSGKEYITPRELAMGVAANWDSSLNQLGDGKLETWLRRAVDNKEKANVVAGLMGGDPTAVDRRLAADLAVTKICMVLDPVAPIRYKSVSTMIEGINWLLPTALGGGGGDPKIVAEMLMREIPRAWFETREDYNPDNSVIESAFRTQRSYLERGALGFGLERVLYEMNESAACLSPLIAEEYVVELRDLLPAMNLYAKKKGENAPGPAVDRHIAAFIAARATFDVERLIADLSLSDTGRATMAVVNLLAMVQWRTGQAGLVHLTLWLANLARPALNTYKNRNKRKELEEELPKLAREGTIVELARLLDSADEKGADFRGFEEARIAYSEAARQARDIEEGREEITEDATRIGQQIASLISISLAFLAFIFVMVGMLFS